MHRYQLVRRFHQTTSYKFTCLERKQKAILFDRDGHYHDFYLRHYQTNVYRVYHNEPTLNGIYLPGVLQPPCTCLIREIAGKYLPLPGGEETSDNNQEQWSDFFRHLRNSCVGQLTIDFIQPFFSTLLRCLNATNDPFQLRVSDGIKVGFYEDLGKEYIRAELLYGEGEWIEAIIPLSVLMRV